MTISGNKILLFSRIFFEVSSISSSNIDLPISNPFEKSRLFVIPPPVIMKSEISHSFWITPSLVEIFEPPIIETSGDLKLNKALVKFRTSFSTSKPANEFLHF